ncbi:Sucrase/ferredoxin-like-domain-containing protein [Phellopilus nigrolimitatus]|nr:Sucrase/ferredoxin-like-domain-containing protein [Phellopilus nigrolimitatus]
MVLHFARQLAATVLGQDASDPGALQELEAAGVPVTAADCRSCADPCDEGHEDYAKRFDVDMESEMRGSVKPYRRQARTPHPLSLPSCPYSQAIFSALQILISTGKADWAHDIASESNSLASFLSDADDKPSRKKKPKAAPADSPEPTDAPDKPSGGAQAQRQERTRARNANRKTAEVAGVFAAPPAGRLSVLNGSHTSRADDPDAADTVLVLPDYVAVANVPRSAAGAAALWRHALDPAVPRAGTVLADAAQELRTWTLPYDCLIMLCSHKKRDARCHIASQAARNRFHARPRSCGLARRHGPRGPRKRRAAARRSRQRPTPRAGAAALEQLQALGAGAGAKKALVLKNSHIGGHKFAGNVIIYFPQGLSVWYGRVTPHEVASIVQHTIIEGKVLAPLLRGGLNISRPGRTSLLDW